MKECLSRDCGKMMRLRTKHLTADGKIFARKQAILSILNELARISSIALNITLSLPAIAVTWAKFLT